MKATLISAEHAIASTRIRLVILDGFVGILAACTIAYHIVFFSGLPAGYFVPILLPLLLALIISYVLLTKPQGPPLSTHSNSTLALATICVLLGLSALWLNRPDADDFSFSHRALFQLGHLEEPFTRTHTAHDLRDLPPISQLHILTAIEPAVALVAHALGLPPLQLLQNGLSILTLTIVPLVYFELIRWHGFPPGITLIGVVAVIIFLSVDGGSHRSFGNFTLLRAWQGKCILVAALMPLLYFAIIRYIVRGRPADLLRASAVSIAGVGLTSSALFLMPILTVLVGAASLLASGLTHEHSRRVLLLPLAALYPGLGAMLLAFGILQSPTDTQVWSAQAWPSDPLDSFALVFSSAEVVGVTFVAIVSAAILTPRPLLGRMMLYYNGIIVVATLLPGTSKLLGYFIPPGAYWRLAYLVQVPLFVGVAVSGAVASMKASNFRLRAAGLAAFTLLATGMALMARTPAVKPSLIGEPGAFKFPQTDLTVAQRVAASAKSAVVLAPENIVVVLGLLNPEIRFISTRIGETLHVFRNAAMASAGEQRTSVASGLAVCQRAVDMSDSLRALLPLGVDTVIGRDCGDEENARLLSVVRASSSYLAVDRFGGYLILNRVP